MIYNVAGLLKQQPGAVRKYGLADEYITAPDGGFRRVSGRARMTRTDRGILVQANLTGETSADCARCLEPADLVLALDLEEEFFPVNDDLGVDSSLLRGTDPGEAVIPEFWIDKGNSLDLGEPVRQAFISEVPIAPLCEPRCRGLCATCGANRNQEQCGCEESRIDPRFEALLALGANLKQ